MAHFAEINSDGIVVRILVIPDNEEHRGHDYLSQQLNLGGTWIQTSYNTRGGQHILGGTPLRKNYAGAGYTYDSQRDAFIPPKPFESWILNESSCLWEAPVAYPNDGDYYTWNEETLNWVKVT